MKRDLSGLIGKRTLLLDGAMGTMIYSSGASAACNEELCLSKPKLIESIHALYLDAGSDIVTTNTFGASRAVLAEHGLGERVREINLAAAAIARSAADAASDSAGPRFVAGDVGPGSRLPTLGHTDFDELFEIYVEQMASLIEGGVDCLLVETCQDPLQAKAALAAARHAMGATGREVPIIASMTVERIGTMLLGTELLSALASLAPYRPAAFGLNCAVGPEAMEEQIQLLFGNSPFPMIVQPNAGMPENVDGRPVYPMGPTEFAKVLGGFVRRFRISIAGGCCGTTPDHISELSKEISKRGSASKAAAGSKGFKGKKDAALNSVSGLYTPRSLDQEPKPFIIAEQTNVNGSKKFREMLLTDDFDAMADVAREAAASSHALDLCLAFAGRDEVRDFGELVGRIVLKADAAIMVDSTNPDAIRAALSRMPGRAIINSINLEDGGERARRILALAKRFGAAVVALTIDEDGMAMTASRKLSIAKRILKIARGEGFRAEDILFDALTFTLASGEMNLRGAAIETLEAVRSIKRELHGAKTILGVSNISFGLPAAGRKILTSVFLHRATGAGLDAAIINPARILPLHEIPEEELELCEKIIDNDDSEGNPLSAFLAFLGKRSGAEVKAPKADDDISPADAIRARIMGGSQAGLAGLMDGALERLEAGAILNEVLLPAMQEVGRRFGAGELALPFVLQSAEVMRAAIDILAPKLKSGERGRKGTIVLATVRGDVHDIGKNLVDIILSNNGFKVINLGIRQPASSIAEAALKNGADAIGLSGLLVSSTEVMREDLTLFEERGIDIPVLCGGAALTSSYTEKVLKKAYGGKIYYCPDAFAGLVAMEEISKSAGCRGFAQRGDR